MKYEDVLAVSLDRLRRGETIDALVAEHPRFADQLRRDLTTAASARSLSSRLPATSSGARARFQRDLQAQRRSVASTPRRSGGWFRVSLALPVLAATAAAFLAIAVLAGGALAPTDTAEASIEGVVVENNGTTLVVQTEDGLQSVSLADSVTISSDETGSSLDLTSLEPGQLILIRGRQQAASAVVAQRIELRNAAEFPNWCQRLPDQCAELERSLSERVDRCQQSPVVCTRIRARLQEIRSEIDSKRQLTDLQRRCELGTAVACRELQNLCQSERPACGPVRDFLRNRQQR